MHGTRVNGEKLREGSPKALRTGDTIQFGERVTRGDSMFHTIDTALRFAEKIDTGSHEGVRVTFTHRRGLTQDSNTLAARTQTSNSDGMYRYPYTSDEESEYDSDDQISIVSDADDVQEVSSAKTTPEQAKAKPGSQEQPIELDQADKPSRTVAQDLLDGQHTILVPESLPAPRRQMTSAFIDVESDDESAVAQEDAASLRRALVSPHAVLEISADGLHNNDDSRIVEPNDMGIATSGEALHESIDDDEPALRPTSLGSAQKASPELRSSGERDSQVSATGYHYGPSSFHAQYNRRYAPTSQQPTFAPSFAMDPFAVSYSTPAALSQEPNCGGRGLGTTRPAPSSGASRWDQLPASVNAFPTSTFANTLPGYDAIDACHPTSVYTHFPPLFPGNGLSGSSQFAPMKTSTDDRHPDVMNVFAPPGTRASPGVQYPEPDQNVDSPTDRISISNIIEGRSPIVEKELTLDSAAAQTSSAYQKGEKRKARGEDDLEPTSIVSYSREDNIDKESVIAQIHTPSTKRIKTMGRATEAIDTSPDKVPSARASATGIAVSVAKYAIAASAGGAGVFAFLCSPASEKVLTWLS